MTEPNSVKAVLEQLAEAEKQRAEPNLSSKQRRARTVSRLAAVQALYQMELAGEGVETVITEFSNFRFDADIEGDIDRIVELSRAVAPGFMAPLWSQS